MDLERQKANFKEHIATFTDYGNIKILDFKKPNSSEYRIRFLFEEDYCRLHISGDLGELVATNSDLGGNMMKIGDEVVDMSSGISGVVIKQYYPTACEHQTMIQCDDGRKYHAPTRCFAKKYSISDSEIDKNTYLNDVGKYAAEFARNHGISISEAMRRPMVKAYAEIQDSVNYCTGER